MRATVSWSARPIAPGRIRPAWHCSRKCSSPTAARSRSASSARCASSASDRSPSTPRPTARALHVRVADEAWLLGPGAPAESYLNQERIVETARRAGAEAIHPGLRLPGRERLRSRARSRRPGSTWIGPPPEAIEAMGSKTEARERMRAAGVPIIPGTTEPVESAAEVVRLGDELGWPVAIKASAGGGGKGFRVVRGPRRGRACVRVGPPRGRVLLLRPDGLRRALPRGPAPRRGAGARGRARERRSTSASATARSSAATRSWSRRRPRRRSTTSSASGSGAIAVEAARAVGYRSAGTIEGLLSPGRRLLLHGDEHAHPGRAHRHRAGHRASTSSASRC